MYFLAKQAFAEALMIIPKILAQNSGFDPQDTVVKLQVWSFMQLWTVLLSPFVPPSSQEEYASSSQPVGVDVTTGEAMVPADEGVWDNYRVIRQLLHSWYSINLLKIGIFLWSISHVAFSFSH